MWPGEYEGYGKKEDICLKQEYRVSGGGDDSGSKGTSIRRCSTHYGRFLWPTTLVSGVDRSLQICRWNMNYNLSLLVPVLLESERERERRGVCSFEPKNTSYFIIACICV